jgi:tetratricopeptide (TPR) repeat protein
VAARSAAARALALSPGSTRAYLVSARVKAYAGDRKGAAADVDRGLAIQSNEHGLLELHGVLAAAGRDLETALNDFDRAIHWGAFDRVYAHKAAALASLGRVDEATRNWSLALRRDPELPAAYLGRARAEILGGQWQLAIADLEQAASWAHSSPWDELEITLAYLHCLAYQPSSAPRWLALAKRTAGDLWRVLTPAASNRPGS